MKQRNLKDDKDLFAAALSQVRVSIFSNGHLVDYGGVIQKYSPIAVKIQGTYYMRNQYEFRV